MPCVEIMPFPGELELPAYPESVPVALPVPVKPLVLRNGCGGATGALVGMRNVLTESDETAAEDCDVGVALGRTVSCKGGASCTSDGT